MSDKKSVQVAVRIRPLVTSEITKGCQEILDVYTRQQQVQVRGTDKAFSYNHVFGTTSTQAEVYDDCVKPLVANLYKGYNVTILAYGQTGSGKTHSMGTTYDGIGEMGVIPRAVKDIFAYVNDNFTQDFTVSVSFTELYQEVLYDLLSDKSREQCVLELREDTVKGIILPGLMEVPVANEREVLEALVKGSQRRATAATNMNAHSSRSHAIFTINLCMQDKNDCKENKSAKFHLVDLAGSERPKKTGAVGNTFREGVNINKGLLSLGNVISALGDEKHPNQFIPYRDSNLTRLLKDSLGGNSITLMIACVSPADYNLDETLSTLRYADRARKIQNKPIVNQDAKVAEINALKKTIQQLRLQIIGQGGPVICPAEIETVRKENLELREKIRQLTIQLSGNFHENAALLERVMLLQNANENLFKRIQELKDEYNVTLTNISVGLDNDDRDVIRANLGKLQSIQEQFSALDGEQKRVESEIRNQEEAVRMNTSQSGDIHEPEMAQNQEKFTNIQMKLNTELQSINKQLALKENLARQLTVNTGYMVDLNAMAENEAKIIALEREKAELLQQLRNTTLVGAGAPAPCGKVSEQRRMRVKELEAQLADLNKKVHEQARLIKMKEKDEIKIRVLNNEIVQMKQAKVKLIRTMRESSDQFKAWKLQRERELAKLKQQDRKKQNQIVKMEVMHSKQQNVLKRKVEEAVALNRRLKDALALRKACQEAKNSGKIERVGYWIKQELDLYAHVVEAKATLSSLIEDRATLQQQINSLRDDSDAEDNMSMIRSKEEDIEIRSVQIQELQQKILDSDEDAKSKTRFDNLQTMGEAKFALKTLFEIMGDIKKDQVTSQTKLIDLQDEVAEQNKRYQELKKEADALRNNADSEAAKLHKEYEDKISVLLRQLRRVPVEDASEEHRQRCAILEERNDELEKANSRYEERIREMEEVIASLKERFEMSLAQNTPSLKRELEETNEASSFKTPNMITKRPKKTEKEGNVNTTFIKENIVYSPDPDEEAFESSIDEDDSTQDPDWRKTPVGKYILKNREMLRGKQSTVADVPPKKLTFKRSSEGGCTCTKSKCKSARCGCKKLNVPCTSACKCAHSTCVNRDPDTEASDNAENVTPNQETAGNTFKRPKIVVQPCFD